MAELTLESLAKRIEALEEKLAERSPSAKSNKDWRKVVGISEENEFTRLMLAEIEANSEAERLAAHERARE